MMVRSSSACGVLIRATNGGLKRIEVLREANLSKQSLRNDNWEAGLIIFLQYNLAKPVPVQETTVLVIPPPPHRPPYSLLTCSGCCRVNSSRHNAYIYGETKLGHHFLVTLPRSQCVQIMKLNQYSLCYTSNLQCGGYQNLVSCLIL